MSALAFVLACSALAMRRPDITGVAVLVFAGLTGALTGDGTGARDIRSSMVVTAIGAAAVMSALVLAGVSIPATMLGRLTGAGAGVAEELLFRKGMQGSLSRFGPAISIIGPALAFAAVHVPAYGWTAAPIDLAAGILFGWQRWASGDWRAPAFTHAFANFVR